MRAAGDDFQIAVADVGQRTRPLCAAPVDQMFPYALVGRAERDPGNRPGGDLQAGRRDVGPSRRDNAA